MFDVWNKRACLARPSSMKRANSNQAGVNNET